jgi:uncharacterized protein (DUF952 family)
MAARAHTVFAGRSCVVGGGAGGAFDGSPVDAHGLIHLSTAARCETAARHFAGQSDLLLVAVAASPGTP